MSEGEAQDGHREGTQGFGGKLGCTSNVILLEIWSEGKDHCSCTLSQVPMLSPLPPSLPLREYPRCRLNLTPQFLWRHAVGWEWTLGGARKDLSYFSDLPQKNVSHFEAFLYQKKRKKKQAFVTIQRDRVPSFSKKEGSHAQYLHCHDQQEGMSFGAARMSRLGLAIKIPSKSARQALFVQAN